MSLVSRKFFCNWKVQNKGKLQDMETKILMQNPLNSCQSRKYCNFTERWLGAFSRAFFAVIGRFCIISLKNIKIWFPCLVVSPYFGLFNYKKICEKPRTWLRLVYMLYSLRLLRFKKLCIFYFVHVQISSWGHWHLLWLSFLCLVLFAKVCKFANFQ